MSPYRLSIPFCLVIPTILYALNNSRASGQSSGTSNHLPLGRQITAGDQNPYRGYNRVYKVDWVFKLNDVELRHWLQGNLENSL